MSTPGSRAGLLDLLPWYKYHATKARINTPTPAPTPTPAEAAVLSLESEELSLEVDGAVEVGDSGDALV